MYRSITIVSNVFIAAFLSILIISVTHAYAQNQTQTQEWSTYIYEDSKDRLVSISVDDSYIDKLWNYCQYIGYVCLLNMLRVLICNPIISS